MFLHIWNKYDETYIRVSLLNPPKTLHLEIRERETTPSLTHYSHNKRNTRHCYALQLHAPRPQAPTYHSYRHLPSGTASALDRRCSNRAPPAPYNVTSSPTATPPHCWSGLSRHRRTTYTCPHTRTRRYHVSNVARSYPHSVHSRHRLPVNQPTLPRIVAVPSTVWHTPLTIKITAHLRSNTTTPSAVAKATKSLCLAWRTVM